MDNYTFYKKNGYVLFKKLYLKKDFKKYLELLRQCADSKFSVMLNIHRKDYLLAQVSKNINNKKNIIQKVDYINKILNYSEIFLDLFKNKKFTSKINSLYKNEIVGLQTQVVFKKPRTYFGNQVYLPHQDNSYGQNKKSFFFSSHLFLENANIKNGTLYLYEGSHKLGIQKIEKFRKGYNGNKYAANSINITEIEKNFKKTSIIANAGDVLVIHGNLIHGSHENLTKNKSRVILSLHAIPKNEKFVAGSKARRKVFKLK